MAVKTPLRVVAGRIGDAIRSFAAGEGLGQDEFAVAGTFDEQTERFYLVVGSFRPIDRLRWHSRIRGAIREEFPDTSRVVLIVQNVTRIDQVYHEMVTGDGEVDITEML